MEGRPSHDSAFTYKDMHYIYFGILHSVCDPCFCEKGPCKGFFLI